jgi:hypothetical protein
MSLIRNLKSMGLKHILSPKKWKIYIKYKYLQLTNKDYPELSIPFKLEQIVYRMMEPGCRACLANKECVICHCPCPQSFYDQDNYCSGMNWNEMIKEEKAWNIFKIENHIVIPQDYIDQVKQYGEIKRFNWDG